MYQSAIEIARLIRGRLLSPVDVMRETIGRIEAANPVINAFSETCFDRAMDDARSLEAAIAAGKDPGPLAGVPLGVKDLEDAAGLVTSYGCTAFRNNRVQSDSIQVARLKKAGAIVVGKTNVPEFGFTGFTKNRLFGITRNPWNPERTSGGSSGGSAAAVASGMIPMATGSDAGGSIRIPACYCGCFGIKPSFGRIPHGPQATLFMTRTWTLGPVTRTVEDAALYMDCAAGYDPADPESLPSPSSSFLEALKRMPKNLKIGFNPTLGYARVQSDVMAPAEKALSVFREMGHRVEISNMVFPDAADAWSDLMALELYGQLKDRFESIRPELGRTLVASIDKTRKLTVEDMLSHQRIRSLLQKRLAEFFSSHDILLTPSMPTEAFEAKGPPPGEIEGVPIPLFGAVAFTYPFNITGNPAATVPTGLTSSGLPAGIQIVAPHYRDDLVLRLAAAYEQAAPWVGIWPDLKGASQVKPPLP
ncbi:MAG: amidase [Desulfobacteraceae bacterium]|jgi:aspartyl-tRNA(Asn)/glutamyl-tRNA(Gln) amidotransferase subunit A|nr:MAG: amidase [Desulfobacteraceae bacterium]